MSGPNVVLSLKRRANRNILSVPLIPVLNAVKNNDKEALWNMFKGLNPDDGGTHDKVWLSMIVNWAPEGGLPLKDMSKWMGLVRRIDGLDDTREGNFTLNPFQDSLVWQRLNDDKFKITALNPLFAEFILDYMSASGHHFAEVTEGMWEDTVEEGEIITKA